MRQRMVLVGAVLSMADFIACSPPVTSEEVPFEDPIKLNVVIDGSGTVWVDEVALARSSS